MQNVDKSDQLSEKLLPGKQEYNTSINNRETLYEEVGSPSSEDS